MNDQAKTKQIPRTDLLAGAILLTTAEMVSLQLANKDAEAYEVEFNRIKQRLSNQLSYWLYDDLNKLKERIERAGV